MTASSFDEGTSYVNEIPECLSDNFGLYKNLLIL